MWWLADLAYSCSTVPPLNFPPMLRFQLIDEAINDMLDAEEQQREIVEHLGVELGGA